MCFFTYLYAISSCIFMFTALCSALLSLFLAVCLLLTLSLVKLCMTLRAADNGTQICVQILGQWSWFWLWCKCLQHRCCTVPCATSCIAHGNNISTLESSLFDWREAYGPNWRQSDVLSFCITSRLSRAHWAWPLCLYLHRPWSASHPLPTTSAEN